MTTQAKIVMGKMITAATTTTTVTTTTTKMRTTTTETLTTTMTKTQPPQWSRQRQRHQQQRTYRPRPRPRRQHRQQCWQRWRRHRHYHGQRRMSINTDSSRILSTVPFVKKVIQDIFWCLEETWNLLSLRTLDKLSLSFESKVVEIEMVRCLSKIKI